jgi:hypothetical protein
MIVEAMRQALEAMELEMKGYAAKHDRLMPAAHALRTAIAEAEKQEPVAWADMDVRGEDKGLSWTPGRFHTQPLYTIPPTAQRPPLTDEAIWRQYQALWPFHPAEEPRLAADMVTFARAIEAAHGIKEKNT